MPIPVNSLLLGRFRVEAVRSRAGGADVLDVADSGGGPALVVVARGAGAGEDLEASLRRTVRYALGVDGLEQPLGAGMIVVESDDDAAPTSAPGRSFAVAFPRRGTSVESLIAAGPSERGLVARVVQGVAASIAALHDQGVEHGHLRPELIVVDGERVRVAGFGVAQLAQSLGGPRLARDVLPVAYRAPELRGAMPARAGTWSDVWALGVLACELLAGRRAPEHLDVPTPDALGAAVTPAVARCLDAALASAVGVRPRDARVWAAELARALAAAPPSMPGPEEDAGPARPAARSERADTSQPDADTPQPDAAAPQSDAAAPQSDAAAPPGDPGGPAPEPTPGPPQAAPKRDASSLVVILAFAAGVLLMLGVMGAGIAMALAVRKSAATAVTVAPSPVGPAPAPATPDAGVAADGAAGSSGAALSAPDGDDDDDATDAAAPVPPPARATLGPGDGEAAIPLDRHTPVWGPPNAPVTIVLFGDLDCPYTRRMILALRRVKDKFGDDVRLAWRNRPIPTHSHARDAAAVAAALHDASGDAAFWALLDQIARSRSDSTREQLATWVTAAGGDGTRVESWTTAPAAAAVVDSDMELAGRFDVRATPTLMVNGIRIEGDQRYSALAAVVRREISRARSSLASGVAERALYATRVRKNLVEQGDDTPDRTCPPVGKSPVRGPDDALVTIVEFSDFECPFCKRVQPTLDSVLAHHPSDVRLVWKNYPLPMHSHARGAASFALEAQARGGDESFWRVEQLLYGAPSLDEPSLGLIARSAGLDAATLLDAARRETHARDVNADVRLGDKLGVSGTPTFFVNGRLLSGAQPLAAFETVVGEEILVARHMVTAMGTPRARLYDAVCAPR